MGYREYVIPRFVYDDNGNEIAMIRVRFETYKNVLLWSTTQLEGFLLGKWLPLIRYDFDPKDSIPVHVNREYISTDDRLSKREFKCYPMLLISTARKALSSLSDAQILDFLEKRKRVFLKEGK